jgi:cytochrome P450
MVTGSDTTEFGVTAALFHLDRNAATKAEVIADPGLSLSAFAEALRYDHPTDMLCRTVSDDVAICGRRLTTNQGVLLLWASANRDEAEFPHADRFDIHRRYERSLLFGHGQHKCIGEHIGLRMGTVMLEEFFRSVADYEVDVPNVRRRTGEFLKGFNRMPVRVLQRRSA